MQFGRLQNNTLGEVGGSLDTTWLPRAGAGFGGESGEKERHQEHPTPHLRHDTDQS
jgi:hypothetical protein